MEPFRRAGSQTDRYFHLDCVVESARAVPRNRIFLYVCIEKRHNSYDMEYRMSPGHCPLRLVARRIEIFRRVSVFEPGPRGGETDLLLSVRWSRPVYANTRDAFMCTGCFKNGWPILRGAAITTSFLKRFLLFFFFSLPPKADFYIKHAVFFSRIVELVKTDKTIQSTTAGQMSDVEK